ncbi:MAG: hypothetical protein A2W93_09405 [Bacteroidetes bacterium GWF2_43_63]|nr:MAG: hypothetical protein A2W94_05790 [Bacteroidetes bacterium GWE2_42_42]OFY54512.1 MAG: hypothetical protein A2W93_09405 [Bacteroidetes bacterium GWF2_43_63]HBG70462.1 hypothetical protein [Bacteroidales bacterium]HCB63420.1 hypothetical protein [Bacteroidales bacterium]
MMKNANTISATTIENIKTRIWSVFNVLRNENVVARDYYIVLFFLSVFKDGIISKETLFSETDLKKMICKTINESSNETIVRYRPLLDSFKSGIENMSDIGIREIFQVFHGLDKKCLSENFPDIFDSILYRISQSQGRFGGEYIQPIELTRLINALAGNSAKIFNPFAGFASFGVILNDNEKYFGQEIDQRTWAIGTLRILAHEIGNQVKYICDDSIKHWPKSLEKFDLIVANPPFGMRIGNYYHDIAGNYSTVESFFIDRGLSSLTKSGKLIALIPQGFLFQSGQARQLRERLLDQDLVDAVISFPGGLLYNTGMSLAILVISKKKDTPGFVRFIDGTAFIETNSRREKQLNDIAMISAISDNKNAKFVRHIEIEKVWDQDYNLSVSRYFRKEIDGVKLREILEVVRGERANIPATGKFIQIKNLKDDKFNFKLDLSSLEDMELRRPAVRMINESCLLLATRWRTIKPTYFEYINESLFLSQDILSFKIDESIVDLKYLINELHADYVLEQLEFVRTGAIIPSLRKEDILDAVIKLPSLAEQRAKVQGLFELSNKIQKLQDERDALAHGKLIRQFNEFSSLKHTLGRPRQNILDWSDNLLDFLNRKNEGFELLNKAFAEFYDIDIISALKEIKRDTNFITDVLEKGENGLVLSEYEKQTISLLEINSIVGELSNNGFIFKIKKLLLKGEKLKERGIYANRTLFKILLDNLLTNANKYAFDKKAAGNDVIIELTVVETSLLLEIKNNGKPFPKNFDREKFITKYSTADSQNGSGIGGYDIHRIATEFNNPDWILSLNKDPLFPVIFIFQFPIKLIN